MVVDRELGLLEGVRCIRAQRRLQKMMSEDAKFALGFKDRLGESSRSRCYSLRVARNVKNTTRISSKHQVTIPAAAFRRAGLHPGDALRAEAAGAGRVVLTRVEELLDRYSGALEGGGLRDAVEQQREEWR